MECPIKKCPLLEGYQTMPGQQITMTINTASAETIRETQGDLLKKMAEVLKQRQAYA